MLSIGYTTELYTWLQVHRLLDPWAFAHSITVQNASMAPVTSGQRPLIAGTRDYTFPFPLLPDVTLVSVVFVFL